MLSPLRTARQPYSSKVALYDEVRAARALALLLAMCDRLGLADVWRSGLPRLRLLGATLSDLTRRHLPLVHDKMERMSSAGGGALSWELLAAQWLLPLGATILPPASLARVWDLMYAQGSWKGLFRTLLALLLPLLALALAPCQAMPAATPSRHWRMSTAKSSHS